MTKEEEDKVMSYHKECLEESKVDEALALQAKNGKYVDDAKLKKHLFCVNKKIGFQNEAGDLQIDFIKSKINAIIKDDGLTNEVVNKCNIKKDTPEDTAFETLKCFHQFAPQEK
ncbi:hypothetical protein NQ314_014913 [Rhamnusium bicolor]|uniref:Uncharacterized protein n=1 Tax=Rhamnusium bicolor TaxID=1586634 RepID=A0AAV8X0G1_9CUCU|nr:hypothetical protein NQ314_014913 [Rhamnusium bicolor]